MRALRTPGPPQQLRKFLPVADERRQTDLHLRADHSDNSLHQRQRYRPNQQFEIYRHGIPPFSLSRSYLSVATRTLLSASRLTLQSSVRVKATLESYSC